MLLTGYNDLKKRLGPQNKLTTQSRQRLHELYLAWNKPSEAVHYELDIPVQQTNPAP